MSAVDTKGTAPPGIDAGLRRLSLLLVLMVGLVLYIGLSSNRFDGDDIIELQAVKNGGPVDLYNPNHLLVRPLIRAISEGTGALGLGGDLTQAARLCIGLSAALGLGLFYLWISKLLLSNTIALIATLGFGTSWAYWVYSIGTLYFMPSVACVMAALVCLWKILDSPESDLPWRWLIATCIATALAILFWQADIFLIPGILVGLLIKYRSTARRWISAVLVYSGITTAIVVVTYLSVSVVAQGTQSGISGFLDWILKRSSGDLNSWGVADISRVKDVLPTAVATIAPVWEGLGLRALMDGTIQLERQLAIISLPGLALLVLIPIGLFLWKRGFPAKTRNLILLLTLGGGFYLPFIVWWDPTAPLLFIVPSIAFWAIIGVLWETTARGARLVALFGLLVLTITFSNFLRAVWPRHSGPNTYMTTAQCLVDHTTPQDAYITYEYTFGDYLNYYFDRNVVSMIHLVVQYGGPASAMDRLAMYSQSILDRGGHMYIRVIDPEKDEALLEWLHSETGLTQDQLSQFESDNRFTCNDQVFAILDGGFPATSGT